ncbi:unnamed protein product [Sphenostylis stenocarpa]|uniref:25S rRNA (uridine-N(3))-methyltransferase BMT5-like domain-containing protein n=1 Tax=Sphenostylis stenocarpa TaxID=92480 RepID=A0AA86T1Q7_9FABA|nr:unnamed protein product [Sphenostylis stenocarpa]
MHKTLLLGFFNNANHMLRANGEIHVSHKTTAPFSNWNLENLAAQCFLTLIECTDFNREDYPGYNNKRGDGYRCDEPFPLGKCSTYKFVNTPKAKRKPKKRNRKRVSRQQINLPIQEIEDAMERLRTSAHLNYYPKTSQYLKMKDEVTSVVALNNRHTSVTGDHLCSMAEAHRRGAASCGYSALGISLGPPRTLQPTAEPLQSWQPWPAFTNALTGHVRTMETVPMLPLDTPRTSQPVQPLQSLHPWPTSNNVRYSLTDEDRAMETVRLSLDAGYRVYGGRSNYLPEHVGTMHTVPLSHDARNGGDYQVYGGRSNYLLEHGGTVHTVPLSHGARNEGDYQVYGGCSNYWQQELGRITNQRASYSLDRYIGQVPGKSVQSELHRINILMSERRRLFVKS